MREEFAARFDPVERLAARLLLDGLLEEEVGALRAAAADEIAAGLAEAEQAPAADPATLEEGVYAAPVWGPDPGGCLPKSRGDTRAHGSSGGDAAGEQIEQRPARPGRRPAVSDAEVPVRPVDGVHEQRRGFAHVDRAYGAVAHPLLQHLLERGHVRVARAHLGGPLVEEALVRLLVEAAQEREVPLRHPADREERPAETL
jgi:hypothetical protein